MEMPDSFADIDDDATTQWSSNASDTMVTPSVTASYRKALAQARAASGFSSSTHEETAACLYMIVTRGLGESDVLEQFAPNEIGTAPDGMPVFIDGWGQPIYYLRWAPKFSSVLQPWDPSTNTAPPGQDSFDPLNAQEKYLGQHTFPLFPLIYSGGPDKSSSRRVWKSEFSILKVQ